MPDYVEYQKSISNELLSIKDRVRNFIDGNQWGEDGRYKEIILSHVLRQHLPKRVSVGTGFVINGDGITKQIDIIVYRDDYPVCFKQDDFVIVPAECVLGIIEVKSKVNAGTAKTAIKKATENGEIIGKKIFNGIFAFEKDGMENSCVKSALIDSDGVVDNICFGKDIFVKYWGAGMPPNTSDKNKYSVYRIENLAFGYFISNLVEDVYIYVHAEQISDTLKTMFYPIANTKEAHKICEIEMAEIQGDIDEQVL